MVLETVKSGIFPLQPTQGTNNPGIPACKDNVCDHSSSKILTHKQILQRLTRALALVQAGNTYEKLLNEIFQIIFIY